MKSFLLWRETDAIQSIRVPTAAAQQEHDTLLYITNGNSCTQKERRKAVLLCLLSEVLEYLNQKT